MPIPAPLPQRRSIVAIVGPLMAAVVGLGVASMVGSMVVAQINRGMATAVNQSGTLRMQSYRIATALTDSSLPLPERQRLAARLAEEYEQRITSNRLMDALPTAADDPVRLAYERVRWRWVDEMRRSVAAFSAATERGDAAAAREIYLAAVDDFVADIHALVRMLEERAEQRIALLRWLQIVALVLTLIAVAVTLVVVQRRVVKPLGALLHCADRVRRGDFSTRAGVAGSDELGRLGAAMNQMTGGLSQIYEELEERVAEKTRDLVRTNRSLELLYRTSRILDEAPISEDLLRRVLIDVRTQLGLAEVVLCLRDGAGATDCGCIGTVALAADGGAALAEARPADCRLCGAATDGAVTHPAPMAPGDERLPPLLAFPVGDAEQRFGLLRVQPARGRRLESWQRPLLESLAAHLTTALALRARMRESRRLVLHEERSILARELHDSLAQSLSYLKIQAARLEASLRAAQPPATAASQPVAHHATATPADILAEMRSGLASAYRQLRELLTTFRLRMDGAGLGSALSDTVREFEQRGALRIHLRDRLPPGLLSANEEVHVLQIVREALSNVVRHAGAGRCWVIIGQAAGNVCVVVGDDGVGHPAPDVNEAEIRSAAMLHHGTSIMRERAQSLGGVLGIQARGGGGTRVVLRFPPRVLRDATALAQAPEADTPASGVTAIAPSARSGVSI